MKTTSGDLSRVLLLATAFCLLALSGCATVGHDFPSSFVTQIDIGKTTQTDIRTMFGPPWRVGLDNGRKTWTYGLYHYSLFGKDSTKDLVVRFDDKGVVTSFTYNTTKHKE